MITGKAKINSMQLFCLMYLFEIGSSVVVGIGIQAKQDAWIAILIGMFIGIGVFLMYYYLFMKYPTQPLTSYVNIILGRFLGFPISIAYVLYFLYIAARVLRDLGGLIITSALEETPMYAVTILMMILVSYGVLKGIEVIGRTGEWIFLIILLIGIFGVIFISFSGIIKPERLMPILENGWKPVLKTVFPQILTFPFGEMIAFTMILPHLNSPSSAKKVGVFAILASGLTLSITIAIEISILGAEGVAVSQFPLLEAIAKVSIANFIERLDILVVITLIFGVFVKIMIFFYAALIGLGDIFSFRNQKQWSYSIVILAIVVVIAADQIATDIVKHLEIGLKKVPLYLHIPLQIIIPLLLVIVSLFHKKTLKEK